MLCVLSANEMHDWPPIRKESSLVIACWMGHRGTFSMEVQDAHQSPGAVCEKLLILHGGPIQQVLQSYRHYSYQ